MRFGVILWSDADAFGRHRVDDVADPPDLGRGQRELGGGAEGEQPHPGGQLRAEPAQQRLEADVDAD